VQQKDSPASIFHKQCSGTRCLLISSRENTKCRRESWQSVIRICCAGNVPMINDVIYCHSTITYHIYPVEYLTCSSEFFIFMTSCWLRVWRATEG